MIGARPAMAFAFAIWGLGWRTADAALPADTFSPDGLGASAAAAADAATIDQTPPVTYYVRPDGGDANQCTGRRDAPYPGRGTDRACAWKHPFFALPPSGTTRIAGGDTLLIASGDYTIGAGAPGAGSCSRTNCSMPPMPSGHSASARTRFLGKSCTRPPRLLGTGGVKVLNLEGSSNIEVGCLEITDQHDCIYKHSNRRARCPDNGDWARTGLSARASSNAWLHDLDIHGMAAQGIRAGGLSNWIVERTRLVANGRAGWDGNIGPGSSNSGKIILRDIEIAWNGCGERWKTGAPWACWAQKSGGYGDGLGTTHTGGQWLIEDSFIHHNTSDGLDLRYMDGADSTRVTVRRLRAVGNAGNQVKVRGNSTIENSVIVGNCGYFSGKHFMLKGDQCRAGGNAIQLVMTSNDIATVRHNTITGQGGVLIGAGEGDDTSSIRIQNNVLVGHPSFRKPGVLASVFYGNAPATVSYAGNLVWNVKNRTCPPGSICNQDPKLADMSLDNFDPEPLSGSPVIQKARYLRGVDLDFHRKRRPRDGKADIGAIEAQSKSR